MRFGCTVVVFGCTALTGVAFGSLVVLFSCTRVGFGCGITFGCTVARVGLQRSGAPVQIVNADDPILTLERTKVLARVGLQRPGAPVQIVDADDPIL